MKAPLIYILILLCIVLAINFIVLISKSASRYWKLPVIIWILLLSSIFVIAPIQNQQLSKLESQYEKTAEGKSYGDHLIWSKLVNKRKENYKVKITLFYSIGFQTIAVLILQIIGYYKTEKKEFYRWTTVTFGLLTVFYLFFQLMVSVIPTGPFF